MSRLRESFGGSIRDRNPGQAGERPRPAFVGYLVALAAVAAVTLVVLPLDRLLHGRAPYALYYVPIIWVAWRSGVGPTLVAIAASLVSSLLLVLPFTEPGAPATVGVFLTVSAAMAVMASAARRTQDARLYLAAIIESSDDAIITKNLDGIIQSCNPAAERLFGYEARELVGRPVTTLIPPEHQDEEAEILAKIRSGRRVDHFETVRVAKDGRRLELSLSVSPIRSRFGEVVGAAKSARDITARKRAEQELAAQREWFDRTLASIGDAVIATDGDARIVFMNSVAERLTGWAVADARGKSCDRVFRIINEKTRKNVESPVDRVLREGTVVGLANSTILIAADGAERAIDDSGAPIRGKDGRIAGVVLVFRDVSDRTLAVKERENLLERERAARTQAEQASRSKDEFVAMVSHELRTPLNAILGWAQMLKDRPLDAATARRGVEVIERNACAQRQLISDLLDMSRIISGKLRLDVRDVDLVAIIRAAIETTRAAADAKGIPIDCTLDPSVAHTTGDPTRLEQCVWNLLSNAIKFTPQGGRVSVTLGRAGSHVELKVGDNGIGIRREFLPFVFERFHQAETSTSRRFGGLGLGLAIVKQLAELHGGEVAVESGGEGQGATFTLALPVHALREATAPRPSRPEDVASLERVKVLLVEDDLDNREVLRALLEQHHAEVVAAASAAEALEALASSPPNVLVSDIGLPEMDGYELIRRVRQADSVTCRAIPAIALTAHATGDDRTRALRAGFQAHMAKPVEPHELVATIASLVRLMAPSEEPTEGSSIG